jgi:hypothetical protein
MFTSIVLVLTAAWHGLAAWHFTLYPARTLARTTGERPVNQMATELFRFLGGMNLALVVAALASLAIPVAARWPIFLGLLVANGSQLAVDLRVQRRSLAHGPFFRQILFGDALFTLLNGAALATVLAGTR